MHRNKTASTEAAAGPPLSAWSVGRLLKKVIALNAGEFQDWMQQAFLMVEGALAFELATAARLGMTEDYVRGALIRGLMLANPAEAARVTREFAAVWTANACVHDQTHQSAGRPIQHDVAVGPNNVDRGLVCEVKWLVQAQASQVASDIWKLALTRSNAGEGVAVRTYLLVGGESSVFANVLSSLRKVGLNLRWSPAGRGNAVPRPTTLSLQRSLSHGLGFNAWESLVSWGKQRHVRQSPPVWASLRASVRARWLRTIPTTGGSVGWRLVLWELDHRGVAQAGTTDWNPIHQTLTRRC